jgi:hypothetical protein
MDLPPPSEVQKQLCGFLTGLGAWERCVSESVHLRSEMPIHSASVDASQATTTVEVVLDARSAVSIFSYRWLDAKREDFIW